jgi:hypothetical protein
MSALTTYASVQAGLICQEEAREIYNNNPETGKPRTPSFLPSMGLLYITLLQMEQSGEGQVSSDS